MTPEAGLLDALDRLTDAVFGGSDGAGVLAADLERLARALEMPATAAAAAQTAAALASGADAQVHLDSLHQSADQELAQRFSRAAAQPAPPSADFLLEAREHLERIEAELLALEADPTGAEAVHAIFRGYHTIKGLASIAGLTAVRDQAHELETVVDQLRNQRLAVSPAVIDILLKQTDRLRDRLTQANANEGNEPGAPAAPPAQVRRPEQATLKVETAKLDQLVDLAGEIMIALTMVRSAAGADRATDTPLTRHLASLGRQAAQLQRTALAMRLVPFGGVFQRLARAFRDMARDAGKDARLQTEGDEVEVDRTILEQLADPLLHMVRNAVGHGLETPGERLAAGKPAEGLVRLAASHRGGSIVIEVADDGRGLDSRRIFTRAVERGLADPAAACDPAQLLEWIFLPGFSTAESVSDLSGRGVGMDVVKRQIQKLRGTVEVRSEPGRGTRFVLRMPLTLSIIDGLLVRVGGECYVLPAESVREMMRPESGAIRIVENRSRILLVRDQTLPLVTLGALLGRSHGGEGGVAAVIDANGKRFAVMADEIVGRQEVVVKNMGDWLGPLRGVTGAAILGDGAVGLILDPDTLAGGHVYAGC